MAKPIGNILTVILVIIVAALILDIYDFSQHTNRKQIFANAVLNASFSFALLTMLYYLAPGLILGRGVLFYFLVIFAASQFFWHLLFCKIFENPLLARKVLIIGTDSVARKIGSILETADFASTYRLVGFFSQCSESLPECARQETICYSSDRGDDLYTIASRNRVSQIVVTSCAGDESSALIHDLLNCKLMGIEIFDGPTFFEKMTGKLMLEDTGRNWLLFSTGFRSTAIINAAKRFVDIVVSLVGLVMVLPSLPLIALLVKINSPGPLLYSQKRVGQGGVVFRLFKFRTMPVDAEAASGAVWSQPDDKRIGTIGRIFRKCRIDEIPQLYNILIGDMSLIGPRPERPEFVEILSRSIPYYAKRHFIKPGLTGWAQVRYPYGSSVEDAYEKLRYDLYYFKHMSPIFDTIIFLKTFKVVLFGFGGR
jgi:sugar transferase (PEP-CTERM system associated)